RHARGLDYSGDVIAEGIEVAALEPADLDSDVDLVRAEANQLGRLGGFAYTRRHTHCREVEGGGHGNPGALERVRHRLHPRPRDHGRTEAVFDGFLRVGDDLVPGDADGDLRVLDVGRELARAQRCEVGIWHSGSSFLSRIGKVSAVGARAA